MIAGTFASLLAMAGRAAGGIGSGRGGGGLVRAVLGSLLERACPEPVAVRLLGVTVSNLEVRAAHQPTLWR